MQFPLSTLLLFHFFLNLVFLFYAFFLLFTPSLPLRNLTTPFLIKTTSSNFYISLHFVFSSIPSIFHSFESFLTNSLSLPPTSFHSSTFFLPLTTHPCTLLTTPLTLPLATSTLSQFTSRSVNSFFPLSTFLSFYLTLLHCLLSFPLYLRNSTHASLQFFLS